MATSSFIDQIKAHSNAEVAEEYLKIFNSITSSKNVINSLPEKKEQKELIPSFYIKKNISKKVMVDALIQKKMQQYKKKIITDEDINYIQNELNRYENCKFSSINFAFIGNQLGEEKSMIFSKSILNQFETKTGDFDIIGYIGFLKYFSKTQYSMLHFIRIDETFNNIFTKKQLRDFIKLCIPQICSLKELSNDFIEIYTIITSEYLIFDIYPVYINGFPVRDLLCSTMFRRFIEMDNFDLSTNPLSKHNVQELYNLFQTYTSNDNGRHMQADLINKESLICINSYHFTKVFIDRLFETSCLVNCEYFDLTLFLRFYFSLMEMNKRNGTHFFFKLIDIDEDGMIGFSDILYFFKANIDESGLEIDFESFLSEIYDLVSCNENYVSEEKLFESEKRSSFINLLIDVNSFTNWAREDYIDDDIDIEQDDDFYS